jgi:hypothetical protein
MIRNNMRQVYRLVLINLGVLFTLLAVVMIGSRPAAALPGAPGAEPPPLPNQYYGRVTINGENAPVGVIISAWCGGGQVAAAPTYSYNTESWYFIDVPGDDPATPGQIEGCAGGATVNLKIGAFPADQSSTWISGAQIELHLNATAELIKVFLPLVRR